jgi:hypothetical protein
MKNHEQKNKKSFNLNFSLINKNNSNKEIREKLTELEEIWQEIREKYIEKEIETIR